MITNFSSHLLGSIVWRATKSSAGVIGLLKSVVSEWVPKSRLKTSFTTIGFSFMSLGKASITSSFFNPFNTGIRKRTSDTRDRYKSRTRSTSSELGRTEKQKISHLHLSIAYTINIQLIIKNWLILVLANLVTMWK